MGLGGFRVWGLGLRVQSLGCRVEGVVSWVEGTGTTSVCVCFCRWRGGVIATAAHLSPLCWFLSLSLSLSLSLALFFSFLPLFVLHHCAAAQIYLFIFFIYLFIYFVLHHCAAAQLSQLPRRRAVSVGILLKCLPDILKSQCPSAFTRQKTL